MKKITDNKLLEKPKLITNIVVDIEFQIPKGHIWVTALGDNIPVKQMTTVHIKRCIDCWNGVGNKHIPNGYLGGKEKWLKIFNDELVSRN